jgi:glycosyltransferase involved in cell wall biosynthesis
MTRSGRATRRAPIVLVEFSPSGGLFQFAFQLGEEIAATGHEVQLLTGPDPELASTVDGFLIQPVLPTWHPADPAGAAPKWRRWRRVTRAGRLLLAWIVLTVHLLRLRPRAVLWSNWRFFFEPLFVVAIATLLRTSLMGLVAHEPLPRSDAKNTSVVRSGRLLNSALAAAWRRLDVVFVLGSSTRELVLRHWSPRGTVVVIPHGDERVLAGHVDGAATPVADTAPVVLFFGTWSTYKGIEVLLDAFVVVRRSVPDARLVLAGAVGADLNLPRLKARAETVGGVDARPGYVAVEDVPRILNEARLVVTPYIRATQSGVAHLAHTFGRPVVATTVGDIPEVVRHGENGLLVPPADATELAAALVELLLDPHRAAEMGSAGQRRLTTESSWAEAARRMLVAFDGAAGRNGG